MIPEGFSGLVDDAISTLHELCTPEGILASSIEADNYKRIWARDSIVCGIAGLFVKDEKIIEGLKNSLITLAHHQNELGMIPSNALPQENDVSFGSLVGRIDANTWFVLGCCLYYHHTQDDTFWNTIRPKVLKCRSFLKATEFNNKGWLYTPLSGNWADEYPVHGYTLYDNMLRLWGAHYWCLIEGTTPGNNTRTFANFWPSEDTDEALIYQKTAFERLDPEALRHFIAFILPGKYDTRFDAAGNGLALLQTQLTDNQKSKLSKFIGSLELNIGKPLIPAFWPIITDESEDWHLMEGNYSFDFKNHPGAFHNGGIWPVWMGLFCLGLAQNEMHDEVEKIVGAFSQVVLADPTWNFQEYIHGITHELGGKTKMGYTASGIVFMHLALTSKTA